MAACYLHPTERALVSTRMTPKRLAEFIAGRLAARTAVRHLLGEQAIETFPRILREGNGPTGCPRVVTEASDLDLGVSISHTDGVAIAAACFGRIGLDLATIETQSRCFVEDTFSSRELILWAAWLRLHCTSALALTTAFAAKEAALKWLGTGFGLPLRAIEILPDGAGVDEFPATFPDSNVIFPARLIERGRRHPQLLTGRLAHFGAKVSVLFVKAA
ncbi:MAG TPA: 4'-phosphopantetheinyl transferase superfamily protein [Polyangiaceae bacterium]